jgi:uncharacterized 2Fe-2S/4Fe-4S cluster protein (DUF4445 family)
VALGHPHGRCFAQDGNEGENKKRKQRRIDIESRSVMGSGDIKVAFLPELHARTTEFGTTILEAAHRVGHPLRADCGGNGTCGHCKVYVRFFSPEEDIKAALAVFADQEEELTLDTVTELLSQKDSNPLEEVLACRTALDRPAVIYIPPTSRDLSDQNLRVLVRSSGEEKTTPKRNGQKSSLTTATARTEILTLPAPSRQDPVPDMERLARELNLASLRCSPRLLGQLPTILRESEWEVCCTLFRDELIAVTPTSSAAVKFALAIDIGTTTLAIKLLDLQTRDVLAVEAKRNPQTRVGDDILSRILESARGQDSLEQLHRSVVEAVNEMIGNLCRTARIAPERIAVATVAGNTAMQQIFCGIDPQFLGVSPFVPVARTLPTMKAAEVGLRLHPEAPLYVFPVIGGFVGGDLVAGILSTKLTESEGPAILIDIGTNGEVILCHEKKLIAAATAAGPTFEGARIRHGMAASIGAIEQCRVEDGDLSLKTIGQAPPVGICGSGLIDIAAELLRNDIVSSTGQLRSAENAPHSLSEGLKRRMIRWENRPAFLLASREESGRDDEPVMITQNDLRQLQLATGAIRAGVRLLLHRQGISPESLKNVFLGGGFGNFLRRANAQRIGLLPWEIPVSRIQYRGNTSLAGAVALLLEHDGCGQAREIANKARHIDLSTCSEFQNFFADAMLFPEQ